MKNIINKMTKSAALKPFVIFGKRRLSEIRCRLQTARTDFPEWVFIENTNRCNIHCVMCPREKLKRKQEFMEFGLFEKLAKEIAQNKEKVKRLHLHNFGEPLLDKDLTKRIKTAKDLGIKHTYIVSNGSLFTADRAKEIIESGLDEMKFSFYGTDADTYNRTMVGLDFNKTLSNVKEFFAIRKKLGRSNPKVVIQYMEMPSNMSKTDEFVRLVEPLLDKSAGDSFFVTPLYNYGTGRAFLKPGDVARICTFPWRLMVILANGDVALCAPDYNGEQIVGNVNKNTIKEIWNGAAYKKVRDDFRRFKYQDYPVCRECTVVCDTVQAWNDK